MIRHIGFGRLLAAVTWTTGRRAAFVGATLISLATHAALAESDIAFTSPGVNAQAKPAAAPQPSTKPAITAAPTTKPAIAKTPAAPPAAAAVAPPPTAPIVPEDLSAFRTVDSAITAKISATATPATSQTGYLGIVGSSSAGAAVRVDDVEAGSPAALAGVKAGDLLLAVSETSIASPEALREVLQSHRPGDGIDLAIQRGDKKMTLRVTLRATSRPMHLGGHRAVLGVQLGDEAAGGAAIVHTTPGLPAEVAGIKAGDVLLKIDGIVLTGASKVGESLAQRQPGDTVTVVYRRAGKEAELKLQLAADPNADPRDAQPQQQPAQVLWKKDAYRLAVICVEFPDLQHNSDITAKDWGEAFFSRDTYHERASVTGQTCYGSLNDYYLEQSCGKLHVVGKIFDWVQMSKKRTEYGQGTTVLARMPFLDEAMELVLTRKGNNALKDFDGVAFIYAGDHVAGTNRGGLYWPHKSMMSHKGVRWNYFIAPEGGKIMASISVYCHEFGHMLGMPDLYARPETPGAVGLGTWCAMSMQAPGGRPQHFSAWCKEQLGWLNPTAIDPTVKQKLILAPVEGKSHECFKVLIRPDGSEYLLLENRRKSGFDESLLGEGLLIWRVVNNRPILQESHGIEGPNGPMVYLPAVPYPSIANDSFTPYTTPSSRSLLGGGLPVYLTNIRKLPDGRVTFYIGYEFE